jgi:hypothetical protein
MSCFVKIPYGMRLEFPNRCPFGGALNPRAKVKLSKSRFEWLLPIPLLGWFSGYRLAHVNLPATKAREFADVSLRVIRRTLPLVGIVGGLVYVRFTDNQSFNSKTCAGILFGGVVIGWFATFVRAMILCRARLVAFGRSSCEMRFEDEDYARTFAELNGLPLGRERIS